MTSDPMTSLDPEAERQKFGAQVAQDVFVWMLLAFGSASTPLAPYVIYAGGFAVLFAVAYQLTKSVE